MRALLVATGYRKVMEPLVSYRPTVLLNIADKPIIFHIIEALIKRKITDFDLILSHFPEQVEECLGDGKRWGINIRYHLAKDPNTPFASIIPAVRTWKEEPVLFGVADSLPHLPLILDSTVALWKKMGNGRDGR